MCVSTTMCTLVRAPLCYALHHTLRVWSDGKTRVLQYCTYHSRLHVRPPARSHARRRGGHLFACERVAVQNTHARNQSGNDTHSLPGSGGSMGELNISGFMQRIISTPARRRFSCGGCVFFCLYIDAKMLTTTNGAHF